MFKLVFFALESNKFYNLSKTFRRLLKMHTVKFNYKKSKLGDRLLFRLTKTLNT